MSDIKPKLILRPGVNISEKSPSPSTKLMLNHGKPNFTINRCKSKNDSQNTQAPATEASQIVLKSTTFNGFIKPSSLNISTENEVNKVVLRRTKLPETNGKHVQDDEPEFIKAQRKIAERLAKENNLDFEHRKSGYFTHVMMSPTTPTKPMEVPVIESGKIKTATVLDATEVLAPAKLELEPKEAPAEVPKPAEVLKPAEVPKPTEEAVMENEQAAVEEKPTQNGHDLIQLDDINEEEEKQAEVVQVAQALVQDVVQSAVPEDIPAEKQNGHSNDLQNGDSQPLIPEQTEISLEPKIVESSNEPNNETVKAAKEVETSDKDAELLQEMSKLKFDINADSDDLKVTPVLRAAE